MNYLNFWGSYVGLCFGLIGTYFSFGILYYLAERGIFEPWGIIIMFILPLLGFFVGGYVHNKFKQVG